MEKIKVLELYSGIGGFHYSLLQYVINCTKNEKENVGDTYIRTTQNKEGMDSMFQFIAFDLNPIANETYYHNFKNNIIYLKNKSEINYILSALWKKDEDNDIEKPHINLKKKNKKVKHTFDKRKNYIIQTDVRNITLHFLEAFQFDMVFISNPCQPFTRQNKSFKKINLSVINKLNRDIKHTYETKRIVDETSLFDTNSPEIPADLGYINNNREMETDDRVDSFIHICNLLQKGNVNYLPEYIFIENVKNFEVSAAFLYFIQSVKHNYEFQTYLLSPLQLGIPNERLRFYCICKKRKSGRENSIIPNQPHSDLYTNSLIPKTVLPYKCAKQNEIKFYMPSLATFLDGSERFPIRNKRWEIRNLYNNYVNQFEVHKETLKMNSAFCFDILNVNESTRFCCFNSGEYNKRRNRINNSFSKAADGTDNEKKLHSMCFTSNYARYINGSGSILFFENEEGEDGEEKNKKTTKWNHTTIWTESLNETQIKQISTLYKHPEMIKYENKVRYFTPLEISRLMGFKMKTSTNDDLAKNKLEKKTIGKNNQIGTNSYGNSFWNMDHLRHRCAYSPNIHYCSGSENYCFFNTDDFFVCCSSSEEKRVMTEEEKEEIKKGVKTEKDNIPCLCHEFSFPDFLTNRQKYKLIGNSVNVVVVSLIFYTHRILENWNGS